MEAISNSTNEIMISRSARETEEEQRMMIDVRISSSPPAWMLNVMKRNNGMNPCFFGDKTLTAADRDRNQSRFLFHKYDVFNFIVPGLMEHEIIAANLVNVADKKIMNKGEIYNDAKIKLGRSKHHEGLPVILYTVNGWRFNLVLTRLYSKSVVIKGKEWNIVPVMGGIKVGDHVQVWSFRKMVESELRLCLVIGKD